MSQLDFNSSEFNRHIGDGVYCSFDGYHIWLAVNHHENKVVALEPAVLMSLNQYAKDIRDAIERAREDTQSE